MIDNPPTAKQEEPERIRFVVECDVADMPRDMQYDKPLSVPEIAEGLRISLENEYRSEGLQNFRVRADSEGGEAPIDMLLFCPACWEQHIDAAEDERHYRFRLEVWGRDVQPEGVPTRWTNPPHRSHLCHKCGAIWRPADVPTNGVAKISTAGSRDSWKPCAAQSAVAGPTEDVDLAGLFALVERQSDGRWCFKSLSADASKFDAIMERLSKRPTTAAPTPSTPDSVGDELIDEVQHRMDQVAEAAVEWHQAGREGAEWFDKAEALGASIDSLLELREKPDSESRRLCSKCSEPIGFSESDPCDGCSVDGGVFKSAGESVVGTVFDNTAASHETLKRTMIERVDAALAKREADTWKEAIELADALEYELPQYQHMQGAEAVRKRMQERLAALEEARSQSQEGK